MPIKPSATFTFATDNTFSTGPATGQPTKLPQPLGTTQGFVPGNEAQSEGLNYALNITGAWTGWLEGGSDTGGADAHIVETDSTGRTIIDRVNVGGISHPSNVFQVINTSTSGGCAVMTRARSSVLPVIELTDDSSGTPVRGTMYMPALPNPTGSLGGDVWYSELYSDDSAASGTLAVRDGVNNASKRVHATTEGYYYKNGQSLGNQFEAANNWTTALAVTVTAPAGVYRVAFNSKITGSVGANSMEIRFSVGAIRTSTYTIPNSGTDGPVPCSAVWTVTKGAGAEQCLIEFRTGTNGFQVTLADAEITVDGIHNPTP